MTEKKTTLETFYKGWADYQDLLVKAVAPLSDEQLALRISPDLRSIGELALHIVGARIGWFHRAIGEGGAETEPLLAWRGDPAPRTAAELVHGLEASWRMIEDAVGRWSPETFAEPFQREHNGQTHTLTRNWIIWHLIEHDLHHGGELSFSLGMHGLAAPDL